MKQFENKNCSTVLIKNMIIWVKLVPLRVKSTKITYKNKLHFSPDEQKNVHPYLVRTAPSPDGP